MKILLYLPTPGGLTGAPRRLLTLANTLRDRAFDTCVAGDSDTELLTRARELGFDTLPIAPIGVLKLRGGALFGGGVFFRLRTGLALLRQNLRFRSQVRAAGADAVWIRASKGIAFAGLGALLSRRPLIWDVDYELPSRGMVRWLHRFGLWASHAVVFQYRAAPDSIFGKELADCYRDKFKAIIPGIDLSALESSRAERQIRRQVNDDPFVILQVGTLCDRKNQLLLLDALQRLDLAQMPRKVRVLLAGGLSDQAYVDRVERAIADRGLESVVELLGWRDDVHALMTQADLLVMPSKDEGVPNTVQEAMYIGLPVMVSDRGGMPEIVRHGGTGWVLPVDDPDYWAQRVSACIKDNAGCEEIGREASSYAEEHFGTDEWGRQYACLVREAAGIEALDEVVS